MKGLYLKNNKIDVLTSGQCNNNCIFCCDRNIKDGHIGLRRSFIFLYKSPFLTLSGFLKQKEKLKHSDSILFTGGEPTLNKDLFHFVRMLKNLGYENIEIQTNGRLLSYHSFCLALLNSGINAVGVSIHGSNSRIHDILTRSRGSFKQTNKGLGNIISLKDRYKIRVYTNFTINKINYKDIYNYLEMQLSFKKIDDIVINPLMYVGNAKIYYDRLFVSYTEIAEYAKRAIDKLIKNGASTLFKIKLLSMPYCLMKGYENYIGMWREHIIIRNGALDKTSQASRTEKSDKCKLCKHYEVCAGIDGLYVERNGWSEFKPVL